MRIHLWNHIINFYLKHLLPGYHRTQVYNSPWQNFLANLCPFLNFCCSSKHFRHQKEHNKALLLVHLLAAKTLDHLPSPGNKKETTFRSWRSFKIKVTAEDQPWVFEDEYIHVPVNVKTDSRKSPKLDAWNCLLLVKYFELQCFLGKNFE